MEVASEAAYTFANVEKTKRLRASSPIEKRGRIEPRTAIGDDDADSVWPQMLLTGSKVTLSNYDQVTNGRAKAQVERIIGPPTSIETKDMLTFKKTTYRYEDGSKFALFTFKNDELDGKEGNLAPR